MTEGPINLTSGLLDLDVFLADFAGCIRTPLVGVDRLRVQRVLERHGLIPRAAIATILRTFYTAPLTIRALQPILDLAVAMNPDLAPARRADGAAPIA